MTAPSGAHPGWPGGYPVVTRTVPIDPRQTEPEVRALTWWVVHRPRFWRPLLIAYPVVLVLIVVGLPLLDLVTGTPPGQVALSVPLVLVGAVVLLAGFGALEVLLRIWQVRRLMRKVVESHARPGGAATVTISPHDVVLELPDTVHRIRTDAVTGGAWVGEVLVLETRTTFTIAMSRQLVGPDGWAVLAPVVGDRVRVVP